MASIASGREVCQGDNVILAFNDGSKHMVTVDKTTVLRLRAGNVSASKLLGLLFGSVWEIQGRDLKRVEDTVPLVDLDAGDGTEGCEDQPVDNRELVDDNTAQLLGSDAIQGMKRDGLAGEAIVQSLISNSATFAGKTAFSKEKYVRRKTAKHIHRFRICQSTALIACDMLRDKAPERIAYLRGDSLAQLLSSSNVAAGNAVLAVDGVGGLLTAAIAERMAVPSGATLQLDGTLLCCHDGRGPGANMCYADRLSIAPVLKQMLQVTYADLAALPPLSLSLVGTAEKQVSSAGAGTKRPRPEDQPQTSPPSSSSASHVGHVAPALSKGQRAMLQGFNSIVVATQGDPQAIVLAALRFARPSATVAVYSSDVSSLAALHKRLRQLACVCALDLSEAWTREYQVLPNRTHPHMIMDGQGGYVLSGTITSNCWIVLRSEEQVGAAAALDAAYMRQACDEAEKAESVQTAYNVGAVLVSGEGKVLSTGYSRELPGNTHAEEVCLLKMQAPSGAHRRLAGCTLYTTMEPCSTRLSGKASCLEHILAAGIRRVVLCVKEPPTFVRCTGMEALRGAGVRVELLEDVTCKARAEAVNAHLARSSSSGT